MSLEELRKRIDAIDAEIVKLIGHRIGVAQEIGREKRAQGRRVNDQAREKRVLGHIRSLARSEKVNQEVIEGIYQQLIKVCRRLSRRSRRLQRGGRPSVFRAAGSHPTL